MRDYAGYPSGVGGKWEGGYAGKAIEDMRKELWNVFIGVNPGTEHVIAPFFDEAYPYVENIRKFAEILTGSHADIGIAPLGGDSFDKCKSELHWLEYAMVGQRSSANALSTERLRTLWSVTGLTAWLPRVARNGMTLLRRSCAVKIYASSWLGQPKSAC